MDQSSFFGGADELATACCRVCGADTGDGTESESPCLTCGHGVWFEWEHTGTKVVVVLGGIGIVTEQNTMRVLARLDQLIRDGRCVEMLIDFGSVTHLTSTAVAHLVVLKRRLDALNGKTTLRIGRPELLDIFRITRLDGVFTIEAAPAPSPSVSRR